MVAIVLVVIIAGVAILSDLRYANVGESLVTTIARQTDRPNYSTRIAKQVAKIV